MCSKGIYLKPSFFHHRDGGFIQRVPWKMLYAFYLTIIHDPPRGPAGEV